MERVIVIEGETPVLLVAPHGANDHNTDIIAEKIAEDFGAYAVINKGWKRSAGVDFLNDRANCNDVRHLHEDVVKEEFLDPILRITSKIKKKYKEKVFMLILHGCSDYVRNFAHDSSLDMILGFGDGHPPSYSCNLKFKNAFIHYLKQERFGVYEGKPKGQYSARSKNNLNQLFKKWYPDDDVNSIQLEIVRELRSEEQLHLTVFGITNAIDSLMLFDDTTTLFEGETKKI